jgi:biopolymer transport protein ExbB
MWDLMEKGGPVMWPLLGCSIIVVTIILERTLFWLSMVWCRCRKLRDEVLEHVEQGDWEGIEEKTQGCKDPVIKIFLTGIHHRDSDMGKAMEVEAQQSVKRMSQFMNVLDTMITVAPLLGILGTVIGIISSFEMLGDSGMTDPKVVSGGIAEALITTATGLSISIFTVFPYNYLKSRIEHAAYVMEKYATSLEVTYSKYRKKGGSL